MPRVVWLASYPGSGGARLRRLVHRLLFGGPGSPAELARRIPDAHGVAYWPALPRDRPLHVATHWRFDRIPVRHEPLGFVAIVRNPWDVVAANRDDFLLTRAAGRAAASGAGRGRLRAAYVKRFVALGGDPRWLKRGVGGWGENVRSWLDAGPRPPGLVVRYEDLCADPAREARRLAAFLNVQGDDAAAAAGAVAAGAPSGAGHAAGEPEGRAGSLSPAEVEAVRRTFAAEIDLLGYAAAAARHYAAA